MIDTEFLSDVWWNIMLPIISLYSAITNALCVIVLIKLCPLMPIYKHMLFKCIAHLVYSLICSMVFLTKCGQHCDHIDDSFAVKVYQVYVYHLVGRSVVLFATFVETWIGIERLLILKKLHACRLNKHADWILAMMSVVSLLVYLPMTLVVTVKSKQVGNKGEDTLRTVYYEDLETLDFTSKLLLGIEMSARGWLMSVLIVVVAMLMCAALQKRANAKLRIMVSKREAEASSFFSVFFEQSVLNQTETSVRNQEEITTYSVMNTG